ncbi:MAG: hypothetical protein CL910_18490 [Deltaproteobacteria bacterium]|jgi:hypothetical protein|nr:hypothetical protein [Deltaproteobacteria bacterium]
MDTSYVNVVDPLTLIPTALAMGIHGAVALLQLGLAVFLAMSGLRGLLPSALGARPLAAFRLVLAILLLAPLLLGAPFFLSLLGGFGVLGLLVFVARQGLAGGGRSGRLLRHASIPAAVAFVAFSLWEAEDPLLLSVALVSNTQEWREHELDWQLDNDGRAPKVGDLAPDFQPQDPSGATAVRLSDFRGKRPVALVFGSYT